MLNQKDPQLIVIDEIVGFLCGEFLFSFQPHRVALELCIVLRSHFVPSQGRIVILSDRASAGRTSFSSRKLPEFAASERTAAWTTLLTTSF
jgi:hypothetical protein